MLGLAISNDEGNTFLFQIAAGTPYRSNSLIKDAIQAEMLLKQFSDPAIETISHHFYQDQGFFSTVSTGNKHPRLPPSRFPSRTTLFTIFCQRIIPCTHAMLCPPQHQQGMVDSRPSKCQCTCVVHPRRKKSSKEELGNGRDFLRAQIRSSLQKIAATEAIPIKPRNIKPQEHNHSSSTTWRL